MWAGIHHGWCASCYSGVDTVAREMGGSTRKCAERRQTLPCSKAEARISHGGTVHHQHLQFTIAPPGRLLLDHYFYRVIELANRTAMLSVHDPMANGACALVGLNSGVFTCVASKRWTYQHGLACSPPHRGVTSLKLRTAISGSVFNKSTYQSPYDARTFRTVTDARGTTRYY